MEMSIKPHVNVADTESPPSNGVLSNSGDVQLNSQENDGVVNNTSKDKDNIQQAGGDGAEFPSVKKAPLKLRRIPTITINDEDDESETVLNVSNSESIETDKDSKEVFFKMEPQPNIRDQNNDIETSTDDKKKSNFETESESIIPNLSDDDKVNELVSDTETNNKVISEEVHVKDTDDSRTKPIEVNGDSSVNEEMSEETEDKDNPDEPLDILGNGLLLKKVIVLGEKEISRPAYGEQVTLRTEGLLENGSVVDKNDSIQFSLGDGDVIQAWDICTALMGMGETCQLTTEAKYAYGAFGRSPDIPANSKITYTLELLKKEDPVDIDKLSAEERIAYGDQKRERGNYLFGRNDYTGAINSYSRALKILNDEKCSLTGDAKLLQELLDMRLKCYNNIAAAQLKVDAFDAAIKSCDEVLKVQPENVKALFRKGKSHAAKGETELSITVLKKALKLDPGSKIVQHELFKQTKKLKKETETEKEMYKKMFGTAGQSDPEKKKSIWKSWGLWATGALAVILLSVGIAAYRH